MTKEGNLNKVRSLIQNGANNINDKDDNERMPLHYAAQYGHTSIVELLLEKGAIYNTKNKEGKTPSQLIENSEIKNLLNSVAKLFKDVKAGNHEKVDKLITKESDC